MDSEQYEAQAEHVDIPPESPAAPRPDDADADADLARISRVNQYRHQRRTQFSMAVPGLVMIAVGALFTVNVLVPEAGLLSPITMLALVWGGIALAFLARYAINGRGERGLLFMGLLLLFWGGVGLILGFGLLYVYQGWPLAISAIGVAILGVFAFDRTHDRGLILPGLAITLAGVALLPFAMGLIGSGFLAFIAGYWPVLLILLGLALLPGVFRRRA